MARYFDGKRNEWRECSVHSVKVMFDDGGGAVLPGKDIDLLDLEGGQSGNPVQSVTRPIYATKQGSSWVGTDFDLEPMTDTFATLKGLRQEFKASTSKGVGEVDGEKVYQLIYPVGGDD